MHLLALPLLALLAPVVAQSSSASSSAAAVTSRPSSAPAAPSSSSASSTTSSASSSIASGPPSLLLLAPATVTACSTADIEFRLRNVPTLTQSVTFRLHNIGIDQTPLPSGAPIPSITSASGISINTASTVRGPVIDPSSVTATVTLSSSPSLSSSSSTPTSTSTTTSTLRAPTSAITSSSSSAPAPITSASRASSASAPARRALAPRSNLPINGTIGINPAFYVWRWGVDVPAGVYVLRIDCPSLGAGVYANQILTVLDASSPTAQCLAPWRALSQSYAAATGSASASAGTSRPSGDLASAESGGSSGLSGGAIGGIVVAVVCGLALLGLLAFCLMRAKRRRAAPKETGYGGWGSYSMGRGGGAHEGAYEEKIPSTAGSPQAWSAASHSPSSAMGGKGGLGGGNGTGTMPIPLAVLPQSERGSIDSTGGSWNPHGHQPTANDQVHASSQGHPSPAYLARGPNPMHAAPHTPTQRSESSGTGTGADPFRTPLATGQSEFMMDHSHEGVRPAYGPSAYTPTTPQDRRRSSPPVSPTGPGSTGWDARRAGDRSSGVASDAMAGRRVSPPHLAGLGTPGGAGAGADGVARKGSVKRKPVPVLEPGMERALSLRGRGGEGRKEYVLKPDQLA